MKKRFTDLKGELQRTLRRSRIKSESYLRARKE
jgi:hypothetical protein